METWYLFLDNMYSSQITKDKIRQNKQLISPVHDTVQPYI